MKKNLKIGIAICAVIVVILLITLAVLNKKPEESNNTLTNNVTEKTPITTTLKLSKYIDIISGDYYMKYKTRTDGHDGEPEEITTEYAISKEKIVLNYEEALTTTLITKEGTYYIVHQNKSIIKYPIDEESQKGFVGFNRAYTQEFFEKNFLRTGTEDIDGVAYYYEEYSDNSSEGAKIRYFFDNNDNIKYIKNINSTNEELSEILELSDRVNPELFELPKGYTEYNINELTNSVSE